MTTNEVEEMLSSVGCHNLTIFDSFIKANNIINRSEYKTILCSVSGGSDSDIMLDILTKVDTNKKIKYVWFDTGLEFQATKDHLNYLESKYGIKLERESNQANSFVKQALWRAFSFKANI